VNSKGSNVVSFTQLLFHNRICRTGAALQILCFRHVLIEASSFLSVKGISEHIRFNWLCLQHHQHISERSVLKNVKHLHWAYHGQNSTEFTEMDSKLGRMPIVHTPSTFESVARQLCARVHLLPSITNTKGCLAPIVSQ
jgi:hypothetical protein